jgi:hypothetical protein
VVWKKLTKVGFGKRDDYTVAWYCADSTPSIKKLSSVSGSDTVTANGYYNVLPDCIKGTDAATWYNECFLDHGVTATNKHRKDHKTKVRPDKS